MGIGPYATFSELGRGGTGVVYAGRAPDGTPVAVKVLLKRSAASVARFAREARLQSSLGLAEGFVPLLDSGEAPQGPYLVLPLITGGSLRDRISRGPLPVETAVELGVALAAALEKAHERGLVHRDLKPENVLFTEEEDSSGGLGRPLVADLGLAKHFAPDGVGASQSIALSKTGELRGTVGYMPAEQMTDSKTVGPEADVFALGAILHEVLTGEPAFAAASAVELVRVVATGESTKLRRARRDVPRWLEAVVARCLAPEPEDRYRDAGELREALEAGEDGFSRGRPLGPIALGLGLALAALAIAVVATLARGRREPRPQGTTAATGASPAPDSSAPLQALLGSGRRHLDREEPEAAAADYSRALELDPRSVRALDGRGLARLRLGQHAAALADLQQAVELAPRDARVLTDRGKVELALEKYETAIADFDRALAIDTALADAWGDRGVARVRRHENDAAIRDTSRAIELEPLEPVWWANRGWARLASGDVPRALVDLDRAIELDPRPAKILCRRGGELFFLDQVDKALDDENRAIALDPTLPMAWAARGQIHRTKGDYDKAIADEDRAIELDPRLVQAWGNRGQCWSFKGEHAKAIADLTHAVELDPAQGMSWAGLGLAHYQKGDFEAANAAMEKAIALDQTIPLAFMIRGLAREKRGDRAGAKADLLRARELGAAESDVAPALARLRD